MSALRKAAEIALNTLERCEFGVVSDGRLKGAIQALREALAQPEQEPVAWYYRDQNQIWQLTPVEPIGFENKPLYTAPPKREWVGLTNEEVWLEYQTLWPFHPGEEPRLAADIVKFSQIIEAKLKEKNT